MENQIDSISEKLDKLFVENQATVNSRINDLKWYIGIFSASIAFLVTGLTVVIGLNLSAEKASLSEFKQGIKSTIEERIGKVKGKPKIDLLNINGGQLNGSLIEATYSEKNNKKQIHVPYRIYNSGNAWNHELFAKFYTKSPLVLWSEAPSDSGYETETFFGCDTFRITDFPPNVSVARYAHLTIYSAFGPGDKAEIKFVMYYGEGETTEAIFNVVLKK